MTRPRRREFERRLQELEDDMPPRDSRSQLAAVLEFAQGGHPPRDASEETLLLFVSASEMVLAGAAALPPDPKSATAEDFHRAVDRAEHLDGERTCLSRDVAADVVPRRWAAFAATVAQLREEYPLVVRPVTGDIAGLDLSMI